MFRLKSVGILSAAKISAVLYGGLALLFVPFLLLMAVVMSSSSRAIPNAPSPALFLIFAVIAPFFYAAMGFIAGAIAALIYNLAAGWIGGVELHFESVPLAQTFAQPPLQS
jgi:hypothetical protein